MARVALKKNINIGRVVSKLAISIISLYIGGTVVTELGTAMNGTESAFFKGLTLIGWTVGNYPNNDTHWYPNCDYTGTMSTTDPGASTCITGWTGSGILAVVGVIAIAAIVMEFVDFRM